MKYLLDSDILIDFLKNCEPGLSFLKILKKYRLHISIISWLEIMYGIEKSPQANIGKSEFNKCMRFFKIEIIPINIEIVQEFLIIKIKLEKEGLIISDFDLFIAASAIASDLILVTRNVNHFSRIKNLKIYRQ